MGRDGLHEVVLDEDPQPDGEDDTAGRGRERGGGRTALHRDPVPEGTRSHATSGSRRRRLPLAVAAVVVLVAVVSGAVEVVRERERAALMSAVPRVLDPLDPSIAAAWSIPGGWEHSLILGPATTIGDAGLTLAVFATENGSALVANDLDTGAELWRAPLPALRGRPRDSVQCRVLGDGTPPTTAAHVVCRFVVPLARGVDRPPYGPGAETRLVVLDARTGERVTERSLGVGYWAMDAVEGDVVLVEIPADGRPVVTREDPVAGTVHWTFRGDIPMPSAGLTAGPPARPFVTVQGDVITVVGPATWALTGHGREIDRWGPVSDPANSFIDVAVLPDGRFAVATVSLQPELVETTDAWVVTPGTREGFSLAAGLSGPVVDDGSASDILLTDSPGSRRMTAVDSRTGRTRWSVDYGNSSSDVLVLDRRMIRAVDGRVVAVDTRTGSVLWTALEGDLMIPHQQLLTDGDVVLVPTGSDGEAMTLHALDLEDGRTRWTATGPAGVFAYFALDGRLVALQHETTVLLR